MMVAQRPNAAGPAAVVDAVQVVHSVLGRVRVRYRLHDNRSDTADRLEQAAATLPGVTGVRANRQIRCLVLTYDPDITDVARVQAGVLALDLEPGPGQGPGSGPGQNPPRPGAARQGTDNRAPRSLSLPDAGVSGSNAGGVVASLATLLGSHLLPPALRLPLALAGALPIIRHALTDYSAGGVTSHVLEGMAVAISLARADYTAANTTTFMLALGEYLEDSIARRSDALLKHLLRPSSDTVWVLRDGAEVLVPTGEVAVGDTVIVATGAVIPIDGTVLGGEATVNEAAMTGESRSVGKSRGDAVLSGTLVEDGRLSLYAEQVGGRTAAARIADYVEQSLTAKSVTQLEAAHLADQLVPTVLSLAGASFLLSGDWRRAASVLQADYACALKLATPVAFKAAMFGAGQSGILVKGAGALERLAQADTFVFDKTGTLTTGSLEVTDAITFDSHYSPDDLICLAASVEEHYFHPLALAVVAAARATHNRHFEHQEVQFIVAHGVASVIDGKRIVVGSRHFVQEDEGIDTACCQPVIDRLYRDGKTLLFIGFGGRLLGILALKDSIRANSAATIARLRTLGAQRILLLTGDHGERAAELTQALNLDAFHAELLPQDKARIIADLTAQGARIAFVGDGINDAPALAGAHVGIAMHKGADIARLTADIALLEDNIARVADAKEMANTAMQVIRTNYRLTVGLNTAILGAAALGLLSPITTSILHNGTTLGILLNAMRQHQHQHQHRPGSPHHAART